ncbi:MAG: 50S ribosomal protein L19 [Candidatus Paceibacterota bacterium]|jgi:large subunit ribosomal protein L19
MIPVISPVNIEERRKLDFRAGDTVRVTVKIVEGKKVRLQAFEGICIARKHGTEPGASFTIRKIASGVGMEKIFPLYAPVIDNIKVIKRSKTRRSKLYFIRDKATREVTKKMSKIRAGKESEPLPEEAPAEAVAA